MRRAFLGLVVGVVSGLSPAVAQSEFPAKPIRFVSTAAPGSAGDLVARLLAEKMGPLLRGSIVVENRPGAGGLIAVDLAAKAPADGYTITMGGATTHVIMPALRPNMPYDSVRDFVYMGQVATAPGVLVAAADFPANDLRELIALAKTNPSLQYASWGNGSTGHFCGEMLNQRAGIRIQHIPYKSVSQIQTELYGGHIKLAHVDGGSAPAMVRSGRVKVISTCTGRHISFPGVRSYEDEGIIGPGERVGQFRFGLYAPAGTPRAIADRYEAALRATLDLPEVRARMHDWGLQPVFLSGEEVLERTVREIALWKKVAEAAAIRLD